MSATLTILDIRDDDDFLIAAYDPTWSFGMSPRDSDEEEVDHPFAISGRLMDLLEYMPENELSDEGRKFPIRFDSEIVPTEPCRDMIDKICDYVGSDEEDVNPEYRLHWIIESIISYGGAVPCTRDIVGARLADTDPFEGLVEGTDYTLMDGSVHFAEWDKACQWVRTHLPNVANAVGRLIGFTLDRPVNRIGTTGWDWMRPVVTGEDAFQF